MEFQRYRRIDMNSSKERHVMHKRRKKNKVQCFTLIVKTCLLLIGKTTQDRSRLVHFIGGWTRNVVGLVWRPVREGEWREGKWWSIFTPEHIPPYFALLDGERGMRGWHHAVSAFYVEGERTANFPFLLAVEHTREGRDFLIESRWASFRNWGDELFEEEASVACKKPSM